MGILSRIFGSGQDEDGPDPEEPVDVKFHLEDEHPLKRVKITYDDGTTEKISYSRCFDNGETRQYKDISDTETSRKYRKHHGSLSGYEINYEYEPVKEVVVENVRSFEVIRDSSYTYFGTHETRILRKYIEKYENYGYDIEIIEDEDDESGEGEA